MKLLKNINYSLLLVTLCLSTLSVLYLSYQNNANNILRTILEWNHLGASLWLGITVCFIVYYFSIKNSPEIYSGIIFTHFGVFADTAFAIITYGLASTTSASILKGVYIQQYFGDQVYFNNFSSIDIYSMLVVCLFLIGYSLFASFKALVSALYVSSSEAAKPVYD